MTSLQESNSSPQLQIPRDSPSSSVIKSPSQFSAASLLASSSPSPSRKRLHPNYLKIDDAAPPNKKLSTPTQEEKETFKKEMYKRLAEEKRGSPFYLTPFPILPLGNKFSSISPSMYSLFQQQQQTSTQTFPSSLTLSPSAPVDLSHATKLASNLTSSCSTFLANSPGSSSSLVGNTAGISGLPTPGGSSVGTPPRSLYPSQLYPTQLLRFPFSPPTPSSFGLPSPYASYSNMSVGSSVATPGPPSNGSLVGEVSVVGSASTESNAGTLATLTPRNDTESTAAGSSPKKRSSDENVTRSPPNNATSADKSPRVGLMTGMTPGTWLINVPGSSPAIQSKPHLKAPHPYVGMGSIQSPLGIGQAPYSPAMQGLTYPGSVSSCPSVSSSSGCSSSSENQDMKNYYHVGPQSEYHVGPHRLISEKDIDNQSEEAITSGRNTPVDPVADENGNSILPSEVADKLLSNSAGQCYSLASHGGGLMSEPHSVPSQHLSSSSGKGRPRSSKKSKSKSPYPFSVESCQPSPQGYLPGMDRPSSGVSSMSSSLSSRDSTPDPEELKSDPNRAPQGLDTFCLVPGRLSLLSSTQRYKVTVDEVRRRLSHPECLNASVLGGILRRAKSKNGGTMLRQRLQEIGVLLPSGRRKQTELSLLTALVESESLHLASDFSRVCDNYFPHAELGQIIARQHVGTPEAQHRISMVKATQVIVSELQAMLDAVGGPSNIRPNDPNNPYPGLTNFSLISHGFGPPSLNTGLGVLQTYLQELLAYYEGKKPIQAPDSRYTLLCENTSQASPPPPPPPPHGMGTGLNTDTAMHGNLPQHHHNPHHPLQNPLLHATRHYPSNSSQEPVISSEEGVAVDVTFKEEPVESPKTFTT